MDKKKVIVIGGGILGLSHAYALAKAGFQTTLLERHGIASAASGGNLGQISLIDRLEPWHMKLALESLKIYRELPAEYVTEYEETGATVMINEEHEFQLAQNIIDTLKNEYDIPAEIVTDRDRIYELVPGLDPETVLGLLHCPKEGVINPLFTCQVFRDLALKEGAEIRTETEVTGFEQNGDGTIRTVKTNRGDLDADYVVSCAGSWAENIAKMAGTRTQLHWRRGSALVTQPVGKVVQGQINGHGMLGGIKANLGGDGGEFVVTALSQAKNGTVLLAQVTKYTDKESKDITSPGITQMAKKFLHFFPSCRDLMAVRIWSAVTPLSDDEMPFYGFYEKAPNLVCAAGFKGAFTTAPAVGEQTARLLSEGTCDLILPELAPEREVPGYSMY